MVPVVALAGVGSGAAARSERGADAAGLGAETDEAVVAMVTFFNGATSESAEAEVEADAMGAVGLDAAALVLASGRQ